jgi:ubiquinone/menaquinone biosynthesis C-methylase UbiE
MSISNEIIKQQVSERYGQFAEQLLTPKQIPVAAASCCGPAPTASSCCGAGDASDENTVSRALNLYTPEEIRDLPPEVAEATLGCGNPHAIASLKEGEVVLDLGSGAGLDCFLAARQVGPTGRAIGLDMTDNMLELARRNQQKVGLTNVEFRKGEIEKIPLENNSVDVIISNCVINLSPDKDAVFREAFRVLKPGGRFAVSDMVTRGEVPAAFRNAIELWSGCLSGALDERDYAQRLRAAGFVDVQVVSSVALPVETIEEWADNAKAALGAEKVAELANQTAQALGGDCCGSNLPSQIANKIASAKIQARKP